VCACISSDRPGAQCQVRFPMYLLKPASLPLSLLLQAGYNFVFGLWKYQWDADCELFLRILLVRTRSCGASHGAWAKTTPPTNTPMTSAARNSYLKCRARRRRTCTWLRCGCRRSLKICLLPSIKPRGRSRVSYQRYGLAVGVGWPLNLGGQRPALWVASLGALCVLATIRYNLQDDLRTAFLAYFKVGQSNNGKTLKRFDELMQASAVGSLTVCLVGLVKWW